MKFIIVSITILSVAFAASLSDSETPIVRQAYDIDEAGNFKYEYESGNGIVSEVRGVLKNVGTEHEAQEISGVSSYISPEGEQIRITYVANEDGYHPSGNVLPVAPAIPELIIRSLEWAAAHPTSEHHE